MTVLNRTESDKETYERIHIKLTPTEGEYLRQIAKERFGNNMTRVIETAIGLGALVYPNRASFGTNTPLEALTQFLVNHGCVLRNQALINDSLLNPPQITNEEKNPEKTTFRVTSRHKQLLREIAEGNFGGNMTSTLVNCFGLAGLVYGNRASHFRLTPADALTAIIERYEGARVSPQDIIAESMVLNTGG